MYYNLLSYSIPLIKYKTHLLQLAVIFDSFEKENILILQFAIIFDYLIKETTNLLQLAIIFDSFDQKQPI